jgi:hypothetical protein
MWESRLLFTSPENVGEWYFYVSRKCGGVVFLRVQKMWESRLLFTCPENVGVWYFYVSRKCGRVVIFPSLLLLLLYLYLLLAGVEKFLKS